MPQATTKAKIVRAVEDLPEDATIEDAIERLVFLHKVERGLAEARSGEGLMTQDEVEAHFAERRAARAKATDAE